MSPISPFLILPALLMALVTTKLIMRFSGKRPPLVRYVPIDGLRGYLAFCVFLHHASLWYFYLHSKVWGEPPSRMYVHLGGMSVSLFFMITGFLFFQKLINNKKNPIDWVRFFVSRILRLYPVYLIAMLCGFIIVFALSHWQMNDRPIPFLQEVFQWSAFTVVGKPPINHTMSMDFITAGVTWTLIYEWLFYLSLPIIGLIFFRARVNVTTLLLSMFFVFLIYKYNLLKPINFYSFGAGLVAAFLVKWKKFVTIITQKIYSVLAILSLVAAIYFFETPYEIFPLTLIAIAFIIIAGGNNLFGLLSNKVSRMLGQISYPMYLLHPILLFVTFRFVFGFDNTVQQPVYAYWLTVSGCAAALVIICFAVHYFIELPCMKAAGKVTAGIRNLFA
jgi:peptidoglycan/LPS O-acetylase OafA/YrhL